MATKTQQPGADESILQPSADKDTMIQPTAADTSKYCSIEQLRDQRGTPAPIFCGMCAAYGWRTGRMVTEAEYDEAVKKFSTTPIGRKV